MNAAQTQGIQAQHQAALNQGRFLIAHCGSCGKHIYFPRAVCPHCGSLAVSLVNPLGTGAVYATTTVRRKADAGGDYNVVLIDLDEGVRLMSRVANLPASQVAIGRRVHARVQINDGVGMVVFDAVLASKEATV